MIVIEESKIQWGNPYEMNNNEQYLRTVILDIIECSYKDEILDYRTSIFVMRRSEQNRLISIG